MSKKQIDQTMTDARNARAKKVKDAAATVDGNGAETKTVEVPLPAKSRGRKPKEAPATEKEPREDLVVFAFRLKPSERDLIHRAAGAAKASRYVRALSIAASRGDEKTVVEIVQAVKQHLASTAS